jgi:hypothetical protein
VRGSTGRLLRNARSLVGPAILVFARDEESEAEHGTNRADLLRRNNP